MAFFTFEDLKIAFNLFCCVYGIGTLGMPANFSRAGPYLAVIAMAFMAFANTYAGTVLCKVMLVAPKSVKTYGDLGEWTMGPWGRYISVISQMGNCLLVPCAFLVLGGTLLKDLFPGAFSETTWIVFMALMVMPVCLIPTLKEGAGAAFAGCLGTVLGDVIGIAVLLHGMSGHPSVPKPDLNFKQVVTSFGNLSLAYGAAIVIPALQRQHSDPTRMPRVVCVTLAFISCLFLALAGSGYSAVGCQIAGNLLFTIYPDAETGLSALGFEPNWGSVVMAFLFMQLHITIAFAVIVSPAFYILERLLLGMHKKKDLDLDIDANKYEFTETPVEGIEADVEQKIRFSKNSVVSVADIEKESLEYDEEIKEYQGANAIKYVILRLVVLVLLVLLSIALKDHFSDLTDFVGASCITINSILLPIIFYLMKFWPTVPIWEKIPAILVVIVCFSLGCYVTYHSGKTLFNPSSSESSVSFPFCAPEYENEIYYIKNATTSS